LANVLANAIVEKRWAAGGSNPEPAD
jgi:hypothetical protein